MKQARRTKKKWARRFLVQFTKKITHQRKKTIGSPMDRISSKGYLSDMQIRHKTPDSVCGMDWHLYFVWSFYFEKKYWSLSVSHTLMNIWPFSFLLFFSSHQESNLLFFSGKQTKYEKFCTIMWFFAKFSTNVEYKRVNWIKSFSDIRNFKVGQKSYQKCKNYQIKTKNILKCCAKLPKSRNNFA